jgi:ATP-dependent RNA helicase DDX19/DBP5
MSVIAAMGKSTPLQTEYVILDHIARGVSSVSAHIVVGTPGTMTDLIVIDVSDVKVFVLDEAVNMLDKDGLGDETLRVKKCV